MPKNIKNADRTLDNMSSYVKSLFGSVKYSIEKNTTWERVDKDEPDNSSELDIGIKDVNNSEDEVDKQLDQLYELTLQMKKMGLEMNKTLDRHNDLIEDIDERVDHTNYDINKVNGRINKLLK